MATSSFHETVYIDDKAADILIKGLNEPKLPLPASRKADFERGEVLLKQFLSSLEKSTVKKAE